jgi:spore maturation protein SpmA
MARWGAFSIDHVDISSAYSRAMLNYIWLGLIILAVIIGGVRQQMEAVTKGAFDSAELAVTLAIGLVGFMALWLGVMRLAEKSGLIFVLARALRPVMRWLFPEVPPEHPAMGSMIMNIAANMLGLGNAATPLGLRAMRDLEKLNPHPGTATNAMCTFLAVNTSSVQLIPATTVGILVAAESHQPNAIIGTAFLATICSTIAGIAAVKLLQGLPIFRAGNEARIESGSEDEEAGAEPQKLEVESVEAHPPGIMGKIAVLALIVFFACLFAWMVVPAIGTSTDLQGGFAVVVGAISTLAIPLVLSFFPLYAVLAGVPVYEEFVEGAKEGFQVAIRIIPFLVAILVAIGMFRGAGGIELLTQALARPLAFIGFPPDLVPMAFMRPLSGSGTTGLFAELVNRLGPDNIVTRMGATFIGSSETTFYVIAVYFGSVAVRRTRHAVPAGLLADLAGLIAAVVVCRLVFGSA